MCSHGVHFSKWLPTSGYLLLVYLILYHYNLVCDYHSLFSGRKKTLKICAWLWAAIFSVAHCTKISYKIWANNRLFRKISVLTNTSWYILLSDMVISFFMKIDVGRNNVFPISVFKLYIFNAWVPSIFFLWNICPGKFSQNRKDMSISFYFILRNHIIDWNHYT